MSRLRILLILFFASLSAYFGYLALTKPEGARAAAVPGLGETVPWGTDCTAFARRADVPIFFELAGFNFVRSERVGEVLKKHYVQTVLDPEAFPADYRVLQKIFAKSGAKGEPRVGILSSKGFPLYLASSLSGDSNAQTKEEVAVIGSLNAYVRQRSAVNSGVRVALKVASSDKKISDFPTAFAGENSLGLLENLKMIFAAGAWGNVTAVFTENCRIAARVSGVNRSLLALEVRKAALNSLLDSGKTNLDGRQRLLVARALSEFVLVGDSNSARKRFFEILSDLEKSVEPSGLLTFEGRAKTRENALLLSLYARAYKISGSGEYLEKLKSLGGLLEARLGESYIYPALLLKDGKPVNSQASSVDYSLLLRAWVDCYLACGDKNFLRLSLATLDRFDVEFADNRTGAWFTNAQSSIFAESFRYKEERDLNYPSPIGEGAQALADIHNVRGEIPMRLFKIMSPLNSIFSLRGFDKASLKLAMLANPMLGAR